MDIRKVAWAMVRKAGALVLLGGVVSAVSGQPEGERVRWGRQVRFHDPGTPVQEGKAWWVFSTGNGISARSSEDLESWTSSEPVLKVLPAWHKEVIKDHPGYLWAPDVVKLGERYCLYYSVSAWGKRTSAIGLATNRTLDPLSSDFQWEDKGMVIRSNNDSDFNAIDPQIFHDEDGKLWMVFGSFWKGIHLIELDPATGLAHAERKEVRQLAWNESIEAAAIHKHDGWYYLFVNWGLCCRGEQSTYEIRVGRSRSVTGPYLDKSGADMATGGGTLFLASEGDQIGPGHASFVEDKGKLQMFYHYYDKTKHGLPRLGHRQVVWDDDGWPGSR